jgi:hypothetical protein
MDPPNHLFTGGGYQLAEMLRIGCALVLQLLQLGAPCRQFLLFAGQPVRTALLLRTDWFRNLRSGFQLDGRSYRFLPRLTGYRRNQLPQAPGNAQESCALTEPCVPHSQKPLGIQVPPAAGNSLLPAFHIPSGINFREVLILY